MRIVFKFLLLCLSLVATKMAFAVNDIECGTEELDSVTFVNLPWFENNQFLLDLVDSIEGSCNNCRTSNDGLSTKKYQVPIKAHIYYHTEYPAISDAIVQKYIRRVNEIFWDNGVNIHFYLVCSVSKYLSTFAYLDDDDESDDILDNQLAPNVINVHFVHSINSDEVAPGAAHKPYRWGIKYTCYIRTWGIYNDDFANTLAHELGHTLGLSHTHAKGKFSSKDNAECNNCNQESVNKNRNQEAYCWFKFSLGKKCDRNGDGLCDTDADPRWSKKGYINTDCATYTYIGGDSNYEKDNYGDFWGSLGNNNAMRNIMSYSIFDCRKEFTDMQKGVMYYSLHNHGPTGTLNKPSKFRNNPDLDTYEPDNYWFALNPADPGAFANKIALNSQQHHTFHHSNSSSDNWEACDIDWVYFHNDGSSRSFIIQTMEVNGKPKPDTKISLYHVNATTGALESLIATHDDISSSNKFSKITQTLANGYYAIKIENKITNTSQDGSKGHYYIRVDDCFDKSQMDIVGDYNLCTSGSYILTNPPSMALTTWSASPSGWLTITPTGSGCTVTRTGTQNGLVTLTATVNKCGINYLFTKEIYVGTPAPVNQIVPIAVGGGKLKPNTIYSFTPLPNVPPAEFGITNYEWQVVTGGTVYGSTGSHLYGQIKTDALTIPPYDDIPITVRFRWKGCNWSDWVYYHSYITRFGGRDPLTPNFMVIPNPSSHEISFALEESESTSNHASARTIGVFDDEISTRSIQWIRVLDISGNLKIDYKKETPLSDLSNIKIDVSTWQPGMYIVYFYDGIELKTSSFIVNH